ncbi:hypothetical protein ZIOFF_031820 [Zingiber officinale]|uniref:Uncharacterized protein n=1 Tax=Zingiber officinale TaxID=94328 RepID=A0A8J5LB54_ZINOF|nr:hypothetical protein ZIOFF_031820 [Zingiber officinale]
MTLQISGSACDTDHVLGRRHADEVLESATCLATWNLPHRHPLCPSCKQQRLLAAAPPSIAYERLHSERSLPRAFSAHNNSLSLACERCVGSPSLVVAYLSTDESPSFSLPALGSLAITKPHRRPSIPDRLLVETSESGVREDLPWLWFRFGVFPLL